MKKRRILAAVCVLSLMCASALAAGSITTKMLEAQYMNIALVVDGKTVTPKDAKGNTVEPFMVDGTVYLPVRALGGALGKSVNWDNETKTVYVGEATKPTESGDFTITGNATNVAASGSFEAAAGQKLHLAITSNITGDSVDFFLFDPSGKEQRITIGGENMTKDIDLTAGTWAYNCSGKFTGGAITVVGTIR